MCEHDGCHCEHTKVDRRGKKFCSEACASVSPTSSREPECPCGHPDCTERL